MPPNLLAALLAFALTLLPARPLVIAHRGASGTARAHAHCLAVHPYTVDDARDMKRLLALGVDGMFTNFADRLRALVTGPPTAMGQYCAR